MNRDIEFYKDCIKSKKDICHTYINHRIHINTSYSIIRLLSEKTYPITIESFFVNVKLLFAKVKKPIRNSHTRKKCSKLF